MSNAATRFLTQDAVTYALQYRSAAQMLSDIGAAPASIDLDAILTNGNTTTQTMTVGNLVVSTLLTLPALSAGVLKIDATGKVLSESTVGRSELNTAATGKAVITKVIEGTGLSVSSTGIDAGTGDVTLSLRTASALQLGGIKIGSGVSIDGNGVLSVSAVTGSGAAGYVTFWDSAATVSGTDDFFWDNVNSRLGIGTSTPECSIDVRSGGTGNTRGFQITHYDNSNAFSQAKIIGRRARGSVGSPSAVLENDTLVSFNARGYRTTNWSDTVGGMYVYAAENWTNSSTGTYITWRGAKIGSTIVSEWGKLNEVGLTLPSLSTSIIAPTTTGTTKMVVTDANGLLSFADMSSSQWTTSGSNIYYTTGNVLIGTTTNSGHKLNVYGSIRAGAASGTAELKVDIGISAGTGDQGGVTLNPGAGHSSSFYRYFTGGNIPGSSLEWYHMTAINVWYGSHGALAGLPFMNRASQIYNITSSTATSLASKIDPTGLRIDTLANIHTANTYIFQAGSTYYNESSKLMMIGGGLFAGSFGGGEWGVQSLGTTTAFYSANSYSSIKLTNAGGTTSRIDYTSTLGHFFNSNIKAGAGGATSYGNVFSDQRSEHGFVVHRSATDDVYAAFGITNGASWFYRVNKDGQIVSSYTGQNTFAGQITVGSGTNRISLTPTAATGEALAGGLLGSFGSGSVNIMPSQDLGTAGAKTVIAYFTAGTGWRSALEVANTTTGVAGELSLMKSAGSVRIGPGTPLTTGTLNVVGTGSAVFTVTGNGAGTFASSIYLGPNGSNFSQIAKYSPGYTVNMFGTSIQYSDALHIENPSRNIILQGGAVYNFIGITSTNSGTRLDATGLKVDTLNNLHVANTYRFEVKGTSMLNGKTTVKHSDDTTDMVEFRNSSNTLFTSIDAYGQFVWSMGGGISAKFGTFGSSSGTRAGFSKSNQSLLVIDFANTRVGIGGSTIHFVTTDPAALLEVRGNADIVQNIVQGNSSQTANLVEWKNSSSTNLLQFSGTGNLTLSSLAGAGDRMVQVNSAGLQSATNEIVEEWILNASIRTLLESGLNWTSPPAGGASSYTGSPITGTYKGQKHYDSTYFFIAVEDDIWNRITLA